MAWKGRNCSLMTGWLRSEREFQIKETVRMGMGSRIDNIDKGTSMRSEKRESVRGQSLLRNQSEGFHDSFSESNICGWGGKLRATGGCQKRRPHFSKKGQ